MVSPSVSQSVLGGSEGPGAAGVPLDENEILNDESLSDEERTSQLQRLLFYASSNGDMERVHGLLGGSGRNYVDIDAKDESGSTALIYSSCFGHEQIVSELLRYGASPDIQDQHEWTALMWAINNHHLPIVERLMENGAALGIKTSTNRSAMDFVTPDSDIYNYLKRQGHIEADEPEDFYHKPVDPADIEEELSREQMILQSSINLEVPLVHLNDTQGTTNFDNFDNDDEDGYDDGQPEFVWDRCLPDQMFVFNENDIPRILNAAITSMVPQRSHSQKPIPANCIFLGARYAHYYGSSVSGVLAIKLLASSLLYSQRPGLVRGD
jgi:hypothetical protein